MTETEVEAIVQEALKDFQERLYLRVESNYREGVHTVCLYVKPDLDGPTDPTPDTLISQETFWTK